MNACLNQFLRYWPFPYLLLISLRAFIRNSITTWLIEIREGPKEVDRMSPEDIKRIVEH